MSAAHTYKTRSWKARVGEPLKVEADVASGRHCLRRGRGEQWWGAGTTKRWKQRGNIKTGKKCTKAREMGKPRTHMWGQWHQRKHPTSSTPGERDRRIPRSSGPANLAHCEQRLEPATKAVLWPWQAGHGWPSLFLWPPQAGHSWPSRFLHNTHTSSLPLSCKPHTNR